MANLPPPIPQTPIGDHFSWRDWHNKVYNWATANNTDTATNTSDISTIQSKIAGGVSGTFKSGDATPKTITVTNGIITSIV